MALDPDKAGILDRLSPDGQRALLGQELMRLGKALEELEESVTTLKSTKAGGQEFFSKTIRLPALTAGTRVHSFSEADIPEGKKIYPLGFFLLLDGETAWTGGTGTKVYIADSGIDLIYRFAGILATQLIPGNYIGPASEGVTLEAELGMSLGCRTGKGIDVMADGDFAEGSDLVVTVYGYMA